MKLRLDEYYYIISDEFDEIEDYMPQKLNTFVVQIQAWFLADLIFAFISRNKYIING